MRTLTSLALLMMSSQAMAYDEWQFCENLFTNQQLSDSLDLVSDALKQMDLGMARSSLENIDREFICLTEPAKAEVLGQYGRSWALVLFLEQDEEAAVRYNRLADHVAPDTPLALELPEGHPFFTMYESASEPTSATVDAKVLDPTERNGGVFVDGQLVLAPTAMTDMLHLVQVYDGQGQFKKGYWQEGNIWPDKLLADGDKPPKAPRWYNATSNSISSKKKKSSDKSGLSDKVGINGMTIAAGGLAVVAGTLYGLAGVSKSSIQRSADDGSLTVDSLVQKRSTANLMVLGAGVTGAAAIGLGVTGVLTKDGAGIVIRGRF